LDYIEDCEVKDPLLLRYLLQCGDGSWIISHYWWWVTIDAHLLLVHLYVPSKFVSHSFLFWFVYFVFFN